MSRNIKLILQYDGSGYFGWQKQKKQELPTLQGQIEKTLSVILKEEIRLIGASRTDKGVHALAQVANFLTKSNIPLSGLKGALDALLPKDIRILSIDEVAGSFHARFSAKARKYRYVVYFSDIECVFYRNYAYWVDKCRIESARDLVGLLKDTAEVFIGRHNFIGFAIRRAKIKNPYREIYNIEIHQEENVYPFIKNNSDFIYINILGNSFLPGMVITIVGCILTATLYKDKLTKEDIKSALLGGSINNNLAKYRLPPQGLYLLEVYY